ncbi:MULTISPECIES: hypothetical protein [Aphanizomenon]|uniref:hypothetical protein n=1 Tax=Aphanizomenon TaxID=1175 RepID=UPI000541D880|nr:MULTISPECIES: hypothetical protein [Aphanizomenon]KHG39162.1 hypothetical protein OA07_25385 [Aphanizomenon flos-aquae 2012/KM1/D3]MTJ31474.1 hypothetical protein [Aphanizomenon sp. UHCC 0183]QSV72428.1 MAG: hypothetical protein HEQ20_18820 [Aphanizomenon flos-aquae KM1D3_PB]
MKDKLLNWLNFILVADVFLVILGFGWLVIAVIGDASGINLGLDLWHKLWIPVFNPAIGILMGGALLSGIISWVSKKLTKTKNELS